MALIDKPERARQLARAIASAAKRQIVPGGIEGLVADLSRQHVIEVRVTGADVIESVQVVDAGGREFPFIGEVLVAGDISQVCSRHRGAQSMKEFAF